MGQETTDVLCIGCGETFSAFLKDMADHNAKVVCPKCGKSHDRPLSDPNQRAATAGNK
jgi:DNA-directed RNA polymerase subunit RPC12/RpoP